MSEREQPSYYGRPILKEPVWKPEIPWYLFTGGLGGALSGLAFGARLAGNDTLARRAALLAGAASAVNPLLLVKDLGRPRRFLNMLRVFKVDLADERRQLARGLLRRRRAGSPPAASCSGSFPGRGRSPKDPRRASGSAMATYTGALLADTSIPVWHDARRELPFVFGSGAAMTAGAAATIATPVRDAGPRAPSSLYLAPPASWRTCSLMEHRLGSLVGEPYHEGESGRYGKLAKGLTVAGGAVLAAAGRKRTGAIAGGALLLAARCVGPLVRVQGRIRVGARPQVHGRPSARAARGRRRALMGDQSTLKPASHAAHAIADLWWVLFVVSVVVFTVVVALLLVGVLRGRGGGEPDRRTSRGGTRLVAIAGVVVPAVVVISLFFASVATLPAVAPSGKNAQMTIDVVGRQWFWDVYYPRPRRPDGERDPHPGGRPGRGPRLERRRDPQLLGAEAEREDRPDPRPDERARFDADQRRDLPRAVRRVLRSRSTRNMALLVVAEPRAQFDRVAREPGRSRRPRPSGLQRLRRLRVQRLPRDLGRAASRAASAPTSATSAQRTHDRRRDAHEHTRAPRRLDPRPAADQAREQDAGPRPARARDPGPRPLPGELEVVEAHVERLEKVWAEPPGIVGFLTTVDHKRIGIRYIFTAFVFFFVAGLEALVMRAQLARARRAACVSPEAYNQLFTMHGTTMIFLFDTPVLSASATTWCR